MVAAQRENRQKLAFGPRAKSEWQNAKSQSWQTHPRVVAKGLGSVPNRLSSVPRGSSSVPSNLSSVPNQRRFLYFSTTYVRNPQLGRIFRIQSIQSCGANHIH